MRIKYTELEREKLRRINAELQILQPQANQLIQERNELYNSILQREGIESDKQVRFFADHAEVPEA